MVVKSRITELLENTQATDKFLGTAIGTVERRLATAVQASERRIVNLMRQLETNTSGRLEGVKINLKQAQRNHKDLLKIMEQEYGVAVDEVIEDFAQITRFIERSWRDLGEAATYTGIDKDMISTLESSTWDQFKAFGDDASNRIADAMYAQVVGGGRFSDLMTAVSGVLTGHVDARGRPMTAYTKQFANDAIMNFHNEVNTKKGEDLGMDQFLYVGDIIGTTRRFCQVRAMKTYSRAQIDSWTHDWQGKSGPAYEFRGGYNCRHHWRPIRKEWLDDGFGGVDDDELFAMSQAEAFPAAIGGTVTELDDLKAKHAASQAKSRALKDERDALKKAGKNPKRVKEINRLLKPLKDERREWNKRIKELKEDLKKQGKKMKRDAKQGRKPKPIPKKDLKRPTRSTTTTPSLEENGVNSITAIEATTENPGYYYPKYKDFDKEVIAPLTKEMDRLANFGNGWIKDAMNLDDSQLTMQIYNKFNIPGGSSGAMGSYQLRFYGGQIKLGIIEDALIAGQRDGVFTGRWLVGESTMNNFRHELGHHVHIRLLERVEAAAGGISKSDLAWSEIWGKHGGSWWSSNVSRYSATNVREAFAESFAAYTNPNYKKGLLPREIEKYMKNLLGA